MYIYIKPSHQKRIQDGWIEKPCTHSKAATPKEGQTLSGDQLRKIVVNKWWQALTRFREPTYRKGQSISQSYPGSPSREAPSCWDKITGKLPQTLHTPPAPPVPPPPPLPPQVSRSNYKKTTQSVLALNPV